MSDSIPALIAEARKAQKAVYLAAPEDVADDLHRIIKGLADALESLSAPSGDDREALMSDLIPDEEQLAEANKRYPTDHEVDDPHGETGVARSDPYGYDATANEAFLEGAMWERARHSSVVAVPSDTALQIPTPESDKYAEFEEWEQAMWIHQPVISAHDGRIAGCQCLDRVFVKGKEDWGSHLASIITARLRASQPVQVEPWSTENLEIVNGWLVERGAHPLDYPAGAAYGAMPHSDAEPLVNLSALPGWPVQVEVTEQAVVTLAKHMANVASDWTDICDDDDHPLEHSNWEAYTDDARAALAALGGGDHAE